MFYNYLLIVLEPLTMHTMVMSNMNCIKCLLNMRLSLVQVRKRKHGQRSLETMLVQVLLVLPLSLPPHFGAVSELSAYLDSDCVTAYDDDFDLLLWWRDHKLTYPILSIMARDIMSVPVSTVSSESCFSLTGRILEDRRRRLSPENVEIPTCISRIGS